MVRFSDMLGGSGEPEDGAAAESPYAALANDEDEPEGEEGDADADDEPVTVKEPVPMSTFETPEAVLNRLTQYATSARTTEPPAPAQPAAAEEIEPEAEEEPEPEPEPVPEEELAPLSPAGDDLLPNPRGIVRRGRGRKRHP